MDKICGNCQNYIMHQANGPWCALKRKEVLEFASDQEIVDELRRRGYQGNIVMKKSFIL